MAFASELRRAAPPGRAACVWLPRRRVAAPRAIVTSSRLAARGSRLAIAVDRRPASPRWALRPTHSADEPLFLLGRVRAPPRCPDVDARTQPSESPVPIGLGSGLPLPAVYLDVDASSVRSHSRGVSRPRAHSQARGASESDDRVSVAPESTEEERGPPRCLDRPLAACRGRSPRRMRIPLALMRRNRRRLRGIRPSRHPG